MKKIDKLIKRNSIPAHLPAMVITKSGRMKIVKNPAESVVEKTRKEHGKRLNKVLSRASNQARNDISGVGLSREANRTQSVTEPEDVDWGSLEYGDSETFS